MKKKALLIIALCCAVTQVMWAQLYVKTEKDLADAVQDSKNIVLMNDITLSKPLTVQGANGGNVTVDINMNGKKLSHPSAVGQSEASCIFIVPAGNTLTVHGGIMADVDNRTKNSSVHISGALYNEGTVTLVDDSIANCKGYQGGAIINKGTLTLQRCVLYGNTAEFNDSQQTPYATGFGGGIYNDGVLTLDKVTIRSCKAKEGGAIFNDNNGVVSMGSSSACYFYQNQADVNDGAGGAIYNMGTMNIGSITFNNNYAKLLGGAIWNIGTLSLAGCDFMANSAGDVSVLYNAPYGRGQVIIDGCSFSNNSTKGGGAIKNAANAKKMLIKNSTFTKNSSDTNGGALYSDALIEVEAVTFDSNKTQGDGGAIYVSSSGDVEINMIDSLHSNPTVFTGNTSPARGGGIYTNGILSVKKTSASSNSATFGGQLYIDAAGMAGLDENTSFTENKSGKLGGGIYVGGSLTVRGDVDVKKNTVGDDQANNVFLPKGKVITVAGDLDISNIGICKEDTVGVFTSGFASNNNGKDPSAVFTSDFYPEFYGITLSGGEAQVALHSPIMIAEESVLRQALDLFDNFSMKLSNDIDLSNSTLSIPEGKTVTFDLGGFTLDRKLTKRGEGGGQVITIREGATLNLSNGTLKGGWGGTSGGINNEAGTANLTDVNITGCTGDDSGGGFCNREGGTLTMTGGSITNNISYDKGKISGGGGLFNASGATATLTGVTITGNEARKTGGGGINNWGTVTIDGCTITGNTCKTNGGGVWSSSSSTLNMQGKNTITDNQGNGNVYLSDGSVITVTGSLAGSSIGVTMEDILGTFTSGYKKNNSDVDPATVFKADNAVVFVPALSGDEAALTLQPLVSAASDADLRTAASFDGANIQLANDIKMSNSTLVIGGGKTVTIDLNGKTLDRGLTSRDFDHGGQVITIRKGGTLNLSNGTLTGGYGGNGGGIANEEGTATLTDVTITGCTGDQRGGGISNKGTLTMTGGSLTNNTSNDIKASSSDQTAGGGLFNFKGATATLTGVTITGNKNKTYGGGGICNFGTLTIDSCTITSNTAGANGGAIWQEGTLNLQGKNTITDNQAGGKANNVYLYKTVITVTGSLDGSKIGVRMEKPGTFTSGYTTYNKDVAPLSIFVSDDTDYTIILKDGEVELKDNMGSSINGIENEQLTNDSSWYDLRGRKLDSKPTQKGLYINSGRKVVIQ